jgi:Leucine-rich repeat (LRR) protein
MTQIYNYDDLAIRIYSLRELNNIKPCEYYRVVSVCLEYCRLKNIPNKIYNFINLEALNLNFNKLNFIDQDITKFTNLEELHLQCNNFKSIPKSIFKLINLKLLNIFSNQISSIPDDIQNLIHLKNLYLGNNKITYIPENIKNIKNIYIAPCSYDLNNLSNKCEYLQFDDLDAILKNLPPLLKELRLYNPVINITNTNTKIPFGCKLYIDNILKK